MTKRHQSHKFSPTVVEHLVRRYGKSGGAEELSATLLEETGYAISRQSLLNLVDDPEKYMQEPHLYD